MQVDANLSLKLNISALRLSMPPNESTIEEHFESHKPFIKTKFTLLEQTKSVYRVSQKKLFDV